MSERQWSKYQSAIFSEVATGQGHVVVEALAGSGKTSTIVEALKYIAAGMTALLCAFNRKIADELARRAPKGVDVKTLHSLGFAAVRAAWGNVRVDNDRVEKMLRAGFPRASYADRAAVAKLVGLSKNLLLTSWDDIRDAAMGYDIQGQNWELTEIVDAALDCLTACKRRDGSIDFDDMIWLPPTLNLRVPSYDLVFVDETQDLNAAQLWLARKACKAGGRIFAVGDRHQAIYAFRGADSQAIPRMISELTAKVLPLSVTYRCPQVVVDLAQQVVPEIQAAPGCIMGEIIPAGPVTMLGNAQPGDFILSRKNAPLMGICLALLRRGVRATVQGRDVGRSLAAMIKRANAVSVADLVSWLEAYRQAEGEKLGRREAPESAVEALNDKVDTLIALTDGAVTVADVLARIESLFQDDGPARVICSTVHRAKGLEADQVWLMVDTFKRKSPANDPEGEKNIWYVAITRARRTLRMVSGNVAE